MRTAAFQQLASLEPSFQAAEGWRGSFQVDGQRAHLALEPDGWLAAAVPISGPAEDLLRRQAEMLSLAKVAAGLSLRAEVPVEKKIEQSFTAVRSALEQGLAAIVGKHETAAAEGGDQEEARHWLADHFASGSREWSREGAGFTVQVETGLFPQWLRVEPGRGCVSFRADLVRLRDPEPVSLAALVHFLLALNSRLRLARGLLLQERAALEAVIPIDVLSHRLADKAIGSLAVGARLAKRECAALLNPEAARAYCEFHEERR
jgi:hypothetical protein